MCIRDRYLPESNPQSPIRSLTKIGLNIFEYLPDGKSFFEIFLCFLPINFVSKSFREKFTLNSALGISKLSIISFGLLIDTVWEKFSTEIVSENDFSASLLPSFDIIEILKSKEDSKNASFFKNCKFLL